MPRTPLFIILLTVFVDLIGFGIIIPLLPVYASRYGANAMVIGIFMMTFSLMQFVLAPAVGKLSDRIGRRPVIIISMFITASSYILFGFAGNLSVLFISRIFSGIGSSSFSVAQAYIADVTTPENRAKGMGMFGAAFSVGFVLGPLICGVLSPFGHGVPAFAAAGFSGITAITALFLLPEPERRKTKPGKAKGLFKSINKGLKIIVLLNFIVIFIQSQLQSMIVLFNVDHFNWTEKENGYFLGVIGLVAAVIQGGLIGILTKRFGQYKLISFGILLIGAGMFIISRVGSAQLLYSGGMINALGFACALPSLASLASLYSPEHLQGQTMGLYQSMGSLGRILAPVAGGILFDRISPSAPFFTGAVLAVIIVIVSFPFLAKLEKD